MLFQHYNMKSTLELTVNKITLPEPNEMLAFKWDRYAGVKEYFKVNTLILMVIYLNTALIIS